jgi:hypothetical protein
MTYLLCTSSVFIRLFVCSFVWTRLLCNTSVTIIDGFRSVTSASFVITHSDLVLWTGTEEFTSTNASDE